MASLPVLSSLTDLVKGAISEEFKKLIKPSSLVAAAILLALNLVLVLPPLADRQIEPVAALVRLPIAWQVALGTLALFALGYVISSLGGLFLDILSGDAFPKSLIRWVLVRRQRAIFHSLHDRQRDYAQADAVRAGAAYRLAFEFPREEGDLAPTRLGNVLRSVSSHVWHQYGVHLDTLWPTMGLVVEEKNPSLSERLRDNQTALTFLASLTVLLAGVAVELALVGGLLQRPLHGLVGTPAVLVVALAVYGAGVQKARAWAQNIRTAFDLHLDGAAEALGLRELDLDDRKGRQTRWTDVSRWLAYGGSAFLPANFQQKDWYARQEQPQVELSYPPTIDVLSRHQVERRDTVLSPTRRCLGQVADYQFVITNQESGQYAKPAAGVALLVADHRLINLPQVSQGTLFYTGNGSPTAKEAVTFETRPVIAKHLDDPPTLAWPLGDVPPQSSCILECTARVDEVIVEICEGFSIEGLSEAARGREARRVIVQAVNRGGREAQARVQVTLPYDARLPGPAHWTGSNRPIEPVETAPGQQIEYTLGPIEPGAAFELWFVRYPD